MTLLVVLILVVLWAAVLGPRIVRRLRNGEPLASVDTFYHELHLLERAAPKTVAAAHRLETAYCGGIAPGSRGYPSVSSMPGRPSLVLLEPVASPGAGEAVTGTAGGSIDSTGSIGTGGLARGSGGSMQSGYRRLALVSEGWSDGGSRQGVRGPRSLAARDHAYRARQSRRRRRDVVLLLLSTAVVTGPLGALRSFHALWVFTVLAVVLLVVYVLLAVWAQQLAMARKAQWRGPVVGTWGPGSVDADRWPDEWDAAMSGTPALQTGTQPGELAWAARSGYPGAWDDDVGVGASYEEAGNPGRPGNGYPQAAPRRVAAGG